VRRPDLQNSDPHIPHAASEEHVLPDVLAPGIRIVFCGTAAGTESARRGAYYAHPQNRFWRALHEAGLTPRRFAPAEYALLPDIGLGLTDIAKFVSGMDGELPRGALGRAPCEALFAKIAGVAPRILAFTSLTAGRRYLGRNNAGYGLQPETIGETAIWLLPSPSPAATWKWDAAPWRALGEAATERGILRFRGACSKEITGATSN
jgi:double-stranded uracil-DNA glycosylase